jgi:hypothetical protein
MKAGPLHIMKRRRTTTDQMGHDIVTSVLQHSLNLCMTSSAALTAHQENLHLLAGPCPPVSKLYATIGLYPKLGDQQHKGRTDSAVYPIRIMHFFFSLNR